MNSDSLDAADIAGHLGILLRGMECLLVVGEGHDLSALENDDELFHVCIIQRPDDPEGIRVTVPKV